ncbi:hypothetical protein ACMD2_25902, partial [Ananas comosus]
MHQHRMVPLVPPPQPPPPPPPLSSYADDLESGARAGSGGRRELTLSRESTKESMRIDTKKLKAMSIVRPLPGLVAPPSWHLRDLPLTILAVPEAAGRRSRLLRPPRPGAGRAGLPLPPARRHHLESLPPTSSVPGHPFPSVAAAPVRCRRRLGQPRPPSPSPGRGFVAIFSDAAATRGRLLPPSLASGDLPSSSPTYPGRRRGRSSFGIRVLARAGRACSADAAAASRRQP